METLNLSVRVDANDKKNFEQFCDNVGMNVSTAINMFIKAVLREHKNYHLKYVQRLLKILFMKNLKKLN